MKLTFKEFAQKAVELENGQRLNFSVKTEDGGIPAQMTVLSFNDSYTLVANVEGGGLMFAYDISQYDSDLRDISHALYEYVNQGRSAVDTVEVEIVI